ncbi:WAT1-related protein At1g68170-like isoform X1 [Primulina tabacum]|uniref:WAT1-related protein At1g68170-like isoform X1 n=1 Tax=Primulina tabacum TaxID=48773 RepID=UPI003F59C31E
MAFCTRISNTLHEMKATLMMVLVQIIFSVVNIGYKLATNDGMSLSILVAYRFMFGAVFIAPIAFFVERKKRPKLTRKIAFYGFLCGLFGGALGQNLFLKSLTLTSATFVSAMINLVPAITFVTAIFLRLERFGWNTSEGKSKVFGTLLGIGGAMLLTFFKGPDLNMWDTNINLLETTKSHHHHPITQIHNHNLVLGALLAVVSCVSYSVWLIIQAKAAELYPCPYSITAMMAFWASIQGVIFALCMERDKSQWILGWDIRLLTTAFAGILGSGLVFPLVAWCVSLRGPVFVSAFNPMMLVLVAIAGSLFLQEKLHLGMLLGGILIVGGLYLVLLGKGKELKKVSQLVPEEDQDRGIEVVVSARSGSSRGSSASGKDLGESERRDEARTSQTLTGFHMYL